MKNLISGSCRSCKKKIAAIMGILSMMMLTGCEIQSDTELYNQIQNQTSMFADNTQQAKQNSVVYITEKAYDFCNSLKSIAPIVIVISIAIGLLLLHLVQEDQGIRKKALFLFIITIPVLMFTLTYGLSWLVGTFL